MKFIDPEVRHHFGGGVYAKETFIPADKWLVQHTHKFDHLSVLAQGSTWTAPRTPASPSMQTACTLRPCRVSRAVANARLLQLQAGDR